MSDASASQLVVFCLDDDRYALPIFCVQEIIRYSPPRDVAAEDPSVRGVISLRGKVIPVYDLAAALGRPQSDADDSASIVIVETGDALSGLVVDTVEEVLTVGAHEIEPAPRDAAAAIDGIVKVDRHLVVLLDQDLLVSGDPAAVTVG